MPKQGSWSLILGHWSLVLGSQSLLLGARSLVLIPWSCILGPRFLVLGLWDLFLVLGSWCFVLVSYSLQGRRGTARNREPTDLWHGTARKYLARPGRQGLARPGHFFDMFSFSKCNSKTWILLQYPCLRHNFICPEHTFLEAAKTRFFYLTHFWFSWFFQFKKSLISK